MSLERLSIRTIFDGGIAAFHRLRHASEDLSCFLACAQTRPALPSFLRVHRRHGRMPHSDGYVLSVPMTDDVVSPEELL